MSCPRLSIFFLAPVLATFPPLLPGFTAISCLGLIGEALVRVDRLLESWFTRFCPCSRSPQHTRLSSLPVSLSPLLPPRPPCPIFLFLAACIPFPTSHRRPIVVISRPAFCADPVPSFPSVVAGTLSFAVPCMLICTDAFF